MKFLPELHTKSFLLNNTSILEELCKHSVDFAKSDLCSDEDFLKSTVFVDGNEPGVGFTTPANLLAAYSSEWADLPCAQNPAILMTHDSDSFMVAQELARSQPRWGLSAAAKNIKVLSVESDYLLSNAASVLAEHNRDWVSSLTAEHMDILLLPIAKFSNKTIAELIIDKHPELVSEDLLKSKDFISIPTERIGFSSKKIRGALVHLIAQKIASWCETDNAKSFDILSMKRSDGVTTAHILAQYQQTWVSKSAESLHKKILSMTTNKKVSVAELLCGLTFDEIVSRAIKTGAAFKISGKDTELKINAKTIKKTFTHFSGIVENEIDPMVKMKITLAYYSTLKHLENEYFTAKGENEMHWDAFATCKNTMSILESKIASLLMDNPSITTNMKTLTDINTATGVEVFKKIAAEVTFGSIQGVPEVDNGLPAFSNPMPTLY